ncbi:MAG: ribonuclease R, partial [Muribaculaceae bacterium]|nr:ribonuclease R [Muribaculaceae bacterium]
MARSLTRKNNERLLARIKEWIAQQQNNTYNYKQVAHALGASAPIEQRQVAFFLAELALNGDLIEVTPGKYKTTRRTALTSGTFVRRSNGKNSVITDEDGETISVAERNSMHALNGDRVLINIAARRRGIEPEAEVVEIIEKKDQTFIGTLRVEKHFGLLLTDSKFLATDIFIPSNRLKGGRTGDKAIVRITPWPE